jgi:hypothetical protein
LQGQKLSVILELAVTNGDSANPKLSARNEQKQF